MLSACKRDSSHDQSLPLVAGFDRIAFRVGSETSRRCALLAATEAAQQQGMQGMSDLRGYDAMIFRFAQDTSVQFINHFVPIDLSIGWYDADGELVDHTTMAKCPSGENCPVYGAKAPFRYAVETPASQGLVGAGAALHVGGSCG